MHEISLVRNIFRTLDDTFTPEELARIQAIHLRIGLLSNVEPLLMQSAFEAVTATDESRFQAVRLEIEQVPVEIRCDACGQESPVMQYRFVCAHCGKPSRNIVRGEELLISAVELADDSA
ncbi:MAG: hydrogenase maturation nickel metallochaperone HypA [Bacteroidia bacterium]